MATQKTGERPHQVFRLTGERPCQVVRLGHWGESVRGVRSQSSTELTDNTKQAEQSKEDLLKKDSSSSLAQMSLQPGPSPNWRFSEYHPVPALVMLHPPAPFNNDTAVIIDLCAEVSDQELNGSRNNSHDETDPEPKAKVKVEPLNESEQTDGDEERHCHHECNSQPRECYGNGSSTLPESVSVKSETTCADMTAVQEPRGASVVTPSSKLPRHLLDLIDEWYDSNPGKLPPFATACNLSRSIYQSAVGAPMTYWHRSGKPLEVFRFQLPEHLYSADLTQRNWRLLVAMGESIEPFVFRYSSACRDPLFGSAASAFKAWVGMDRINEDGFEVEPSVFKISAPKKTKGKSVPPPQELSEKTYQNNSRPRREKRPPNPDPGEAYWSDMKRGKSQMYDLGEMVEVREKQLPQLSAVLSENSFSIGERVKTSLRCPEKPSAATSRKRMKHADHPESTKRRKCADEDVFDATTTIPNPERSHLQARIQAASNLVAITIPDKLELHILNSTVLLFFPDKASSNLDSPRPRMLSICDSVGKVFAQALAGLVFAVPKDRGAMVLTLRVDNQDQVLPMVENDEQDFEAFLVALKQAQCWSRDDTGKMKGSCTVEVRARV